MTKYISLFNSILSLSFILSDCFAQSAESDFLEVRFQRKASPAGITEVSVNLRKSNVDRDIPLNNKSYPHRFALIIGNEDYSSFQDNLDGPSDACYAINDAESFANYAHNFFGVSRDHIVFIKNGRLIDMLSAIENLKLTIKNLNGKAEVIFYYAGHGLVSEKNGQSYLVPVDVSSSNVEFAIDLPGLYANLTKFPTTRVSMFLDACFSGNGRNIGLYTSRGVRVKPKHHPIKSGNLFVFCATQDDETAKPFLNNEHGIFTYFVLDFLKKSKWNRTYGEMVEYVTTKTSTKSLLDYGQEQRPVVIVSQSVSNSWKKWKIN